jgi:5'-nucleotidase
MRILVTNDDGIRAPGIEILANWARKIGDVTVVAPKVEQSAKSHSINIHTAFEVKKVSWLDGIDCYSVDSSPSDCIRFAYNGLNMEFDLVLSGINRGFNVGEDIAYSGTDAAIFEAAYFKCNAIAFSTVPESFEWAQKSLDMCYDHIVSNRYLDHNPIWNVNIPENPKGILLTRQGNAYYKDNFKEVSPGMFIACGYSIYQGTQNLDEDLDAIMNGYISITPLTVNRTAMEAYRKLSTMTKKGL